MKNVEYLQRLWFQVRTNNGSWSSAIDWAIERLRNNEEGDDLDVVMLAAATRDEEVVPLVSEIVERYLGVGALHDHFGVGKYIVELHTAYKAGAETIVSLEPKLWRLFYDFRQPDWLVMLSRNCEYATDVEAFVKPFQEEFDYIAGLWKEVKSAGEFFAVYDRSISNDHDAI